MIYVIMKKALPIDSHHKPYERVQSGKLQHIKQLGAPKPEEKTAQQGQPKVGDTVSIGGEQVKVVSIGQHGVTVQTNKGDKLQVYHGEYGNNGSQAQPVPQEGQNQAGAAPTKAKPKTSTQMPEIPDTARVAAKTSWEFANFIKNLETDESFTKKVGKVSFEKPRVLPMSHVYGANRPDAPIAIEMTARDEKGDRIGHFEVHFDQGKKDVYIASVSVDNKHQKKGFGTSIVDKVIDFAKQNGYQKVSLIADGEAGVYAWSMSGFDFDPEDPDSSGELAHEFVNHLRKKYPDEKVDASQFQHPWDIASYKIGDEKVGKNWMLGPGHIYHFFAEINFSDPNSIANRINQKYRELRGVKTSAEQPAQQPQQPVEEQKNESGTERSRV